MERQKFTDTKFNKPIDFTMYFTEDRYVEPQYLTSSTITFSDIYFLTSNGRGIFKTFDGETCFKFRTNRMVNELLCYELGKQGNCLCAKCDSAIFKNSSGKVYDGIMSYKTNGEYDLMYTACDFLDIDIEDGKNGFVKNLMNKFSEKLNDNQYDKLETFRTLYKIVVFDLLTMQCDRHMENVHIIKEDGKNHYHLSPLIDNEYAFCTRHFERIFELGKLNKNDIVDIYNKETFVTIDKVENKEDRYKETIKQIVKYAKKYDFLNDDLRYMLNNMDIHKTFNEMNNNGIEVDKDYQNLVENIFDMTKENIKEEYNKSFNLNEEFDF